MALFWYPGGENVFVGWTVSERRVKLFWVGVWPATVLLNWFKWVARGNVYCFNKVRQQNTDSHLAAAKQSSQRRFSTYLIPLTIRGWGGGGGWDGGSARECCKTVACSAQSVRIKTLSRMLSVRNQTSAQWQMCTASTVSITNPIWQICPVSWLEDEEQMLLFLSQQAWASPHS